MSAKNLIILVTRKNLVSYDIKQVRVIYKKNIPKTQTMRVGSSEPSWIVDVAVVGVR